MNTVYEEKMQSRNILLNKQDMKLSPDDLKAEISRRILAENLNNGFIFRVLKNNGEYTGIMGSFEKDMNLNPPAFALHWFDQGA